MRRIVMLALGCCLAVCLLTGCSIPLFGEGEVGFRQATDWAFYHEAELTPEGVRKSEASIDFPSLEEWLFGDTTDPVDVGASTSGLDP